MTHRVIAERWDRGWELHIDGVGVTQCKRVRDADETVRDYLRMDGRDPEAEIVIEYRTVGPA